MGEERSLPALLPPTAAPGRDEAVAAAGICFQAGTRPRYKSSSVAVVWGGSRRQPALLSGHLKHGVVKGSPEPSANRLTAALDAGEEAGGRLPNVCRYVFETGLVPPPAALFL